MRQCWIAAEYSSEHTKKSDPVWPNAVDRARHTVILTSLAAWRTQQEKKPDYSMWASKMPQGYLWVAMCVRCVCVSVRVGREKGKQLPVEFTTSH